MPLDIGSSSNAWEGRNILQSQTQRRPTRREFLRMSGRWTRRPSIAFANHREGRRISATQKGLLARSARLRARLESY